MLNVVGVATKAGLPMGVNVIAVIRMDGFQERFVSQRSAEGGSEDAVDLLRPNEQVVGNIESPVTDLGEGLCAG